MSESEVILLKLAGVALLVLVNGFFVAAEFALVKVRDAQLVALAAKGSLRAKVARRVLGNLDSALSACQIGITMASLALGWVGEPVFSALVAPVFDRLGVASHELRHTLSFLVGFTVLTFLHITAGEQAPKWLAIQRPLPATLWVAYPLLWFRVALWPFIAVLNHASLWILTRLGVRPLGEGEGAHSEEELRLLFSTAPGGQQSSLGHAIVLNALDLKRRVVRDVMRPRKEILGLDTGASIAECLDVADETRYSRFPLCEEGDLDRTLGVVHVKDLFAMRLKARSGADLVAVAKKLIFVPATARLETVLRLCLERRLHFVFIVDEYGSTVGMATLENILEELVGQIQDEFDAEKPLIEKKGEHQWELSGALPLHELSDLVGELVAEEGVTTTNGLVTRRLGGFARPGDTLALGNCQLTVEDTDGPRVTRLKLARRVEPA